MESAVRKILDDFPASPARAAKALRALIDGDENAFFEAVLPILRSSAETQGFQYLLTLLLSKGILLRPLCDPTMFTLAEAVHISKRLKQVDPGFDVRLLRALIGQTGQDRCKLEEIASSNAGIRLLEIMAEISDGSRILPTMTQLVRHPDARVRSKAALLVGRSNKNHKWVEERLSEDDPRVRANAVESLWGADTEGSRAVFLSALSDPDNRVVGNALLGLYRLGHPSSIRMIDDLVEHPDRNFRITGVWVMGESGDPRYMPVLARLIAEGNPELRANALRAIAKLKKARNIRVQPLNVFLGEIKTSASGWHEVNMAISPRPRQTIPDLNVTNIAIWEDAALLNDYDVEQRGKHEPLAIAFAFPRFLERFSHERDIQELAMERALQHKRRLDVWMVLKYVRGGYSSGPTDADLLSTRMRFTTDPEIILGVMSGPGKRLGCAGDLDQAFRILVESTSHVRAGRHLVLVCQSPQDYFTTNLEHELFAAEIANASVHIITPAPTDQMYEVCSRTAGNLLIAQDASGIPELLERLCSSLLNMYRIRFNSRNPYATGLHVQVCTTDGIGETTRSLLPPGASSQPFCRASACARDAEAIPSRL